MGFAWSYMPPIPAGRYCPTGLFPRVFGRSIPIHLDVKLHSAPVTWLRSGRWTRELLIVASVRRAVLGPGAGHDGRPEAPFVFQAARQLICLHQPLFLKRSISLLLGSSCMTGSSESTPARDPENLLQRTQPPSLGKTEFGLVLSLSLCGPMAGAPRSTPPVLVTFGRQA